MVLHVVCLDGTHQVKDQPHPTNIARLFDSLGGAAVDGGFGSFETEVGGPKPCTGKYLPGVGTQGDPVLKVLGNAFGDGIAEPIVRGYTFLSRNYNAGDEIIVTGFSRGAAAARALAGLLADHGLLNRSRYDAGDKTAAYLRAVAAWYAYRGGTDLVDGARLQVISGTAGLTAPTLVDADYVRPVRVRAVGVFDTVSSLGLPHIGSNGRPAYDFSICDTNLNPAIEHGFHALAADETRDLFSPTFWAKRVGVIQQVFPGCHSDVGGGFPNRGLSDGALAWMMQQLANAGFPGNAAHLNPPLAPSALDKAQDDGAIFPFILTPRSDRSFPESALASQSLRDRLGEPTEILPSLSPTPYEPRGKYADGTLISALPGDA
jgi:uncharacterized protein (DUF2235 family)